jgi:hypothetical protein
MLAMVLALQRESVARDASRRATLQARSGNPGDAIVNQQGGNSRQLSPIARIDFNSSSDRRINNSPSIF